MSAFALTRCPSCRGPLAPIPEHEIRQCAWCGTVYDVVDTALVARPTEPHTVEE